MRDSDGRDSIIYRALAILLYFSAFFPNPALPLSAGFGFQLVVLFSLIFLASEIGLKWPKKMILIALVFFLVVFYGVFFSFFNSDWDVDYVIKSVLVYLTWLIVALAGGRALQLVGQVPCLMGVSAGILFNGIFGVVQLIGFSSNVFPFVYLFNNPDYANMMDVSEVYAEYVRRPMGFFPEPSALTASLGVWIVYIFSCFRVGFGKLVFTKKQYLFVIVCWLVGLMLCLISASGHVLFIGVFLALAFLGYRDKKNEFNKIYILVFFLIICASGFLVFVSMGVFDRAIGELEAASDDSGSWGLRLKSITLGLTLWMESGGTFLTGIGFGQSVSKIISLDSSVSAIWSTLVRFIVEGGILALLFAIFYGATIFTLDAPRKKFVPIGATVGVLFFGITLATSYISLGPLWLMIGYLLVPDRFSYMAHRSCSVR